MASASVAGVLSYLHRLSGSGATDQQLLERFLGQRDEAAFAALVQRHGPMVWSVCRRVLHHAHDAEDAFQATFLVLARRAGAIHKRDALGSWLHGVAYHIATTARTSDLRRRQRENRASEPPIEAPDRAAAWRELQETLDSELHRLPKKYRSPLILCYLEGQTHEEAAQQLGWPVGTVKSRLARARELLRERLTAQGLALSASAFAAALAVNAATAALPVPLAKTTARAAVAFAARQAALQAPASATALAETLLRATAPGNLWLPALLMMGVVLIGSSVGYQLATTGQKTEPQVKQPQPAAIAENRQARMDRYGDPLPDEAIARLGTRRFWCGSTGIEIAYSSDGSKILVANWDSAHVIDAATGKQLRQFRPVGDAAVNSMSLSPNSKLLALGTDSRSKDTESSIQIFDMESRQLLRQCKDAGRQQYLHVRFSPDGKLLASYSFPSKTVYLWDPATGKGVRRWPMDCETSSSFVFSRDSKTLMVGDRSTIHFLNISTGTETRRIEGHPGIVYQLSLSPDGKTLASRGLKKEVRVGEHERDNKLCLWDAATGKKLHQIEVVPEATRVAIRQGQDASAITYHDFAPDGRTVVTASGDGVLRLWDAATGKELRRWDTAGWAGPFAFAPDGKTLAALGSGHTVHLWDPGTGKELRDHSGHPHGFQLLALSPDGRVAASAGYEEDVRLWDTANGRELRRFTAAGTDVRAVAFTTDGRAVLALSEDSKLHCWDAATGKALRELAAPIGTNQRWHTLSPDGRRWASVVAPKGDVIVLWDAATCQPLREMVADQGWVGALGFAQDGRSIYSWGWEKKVRVWDFATGEKQREFPAAGQRRFYTGSFSPGGKWFACGGRDGVLLVYEMATGREAIHLEIPALRSTNPSFAFSPDERTLAIGDSEGTIHWVELASGKIRHRFAGGHQARIAALVFSADGDRLVSGSEDTTALVWDVIGRRAARREPLAAADLDACWNDLAGEDAASAYRAMRKLIVSPGGAIAFLAAHLQPATPADANRLAKHIADLDSDAFTTRAAAMKELAQLGQLAESALRKALAGSPSTEARRRMEQLLEKLATATLNGESLRQWRAIETLEHLATPEARQLLEKLASGAADARLTREAKAAQERLKATRRAN